MTGNIAEALGISEKKINVKATTTEGLGFAGREEGISSYCITMIKAKD